MTRMLLSIVFACAAAVPAFAQAPAGKSELPSTLVDPYLRIHTALVADKVDGIKQDASAIAQAATPLGAPAKRLAEAAQKLERAADLKAARAAFGDVSEALAAYARSTGATNPAGVNTAFCPMAAKPWLQRGEKIQNPYYGSEMLECGEIKR